MEFGIWSNGFRPHTTAAQTYECVTARVGRPIASIHMPVPIDRGDDAYFVPPAKLNRPGGNPVNPDHPDDAAMIFHGRSWYGKLEPRQEGDLSE